MDRFLRDLIETTDGTEWDRRGVLLTIGLVGVIVLVLFLVFVLPRLIGGVVG